MRLFIRRGLSVRYLLPAPVVEYIDERGLYRDDIPAGANASSSGGGEKEKEKLKEKEREFENESTEPGNEEIEIDEAVARQVMIEAV